MAKIRKLNVSEIAGRSPFSNDNDAVMPAGTIVVYEGNNEGEYVLRVHDGVTNGGNPFPNAPSIVHNNDVNITINSGDSSSYTWNFGQTGDLRFPDGTNYSGNDITVPSIGVPFGSVTNITDNQGWDENNVGINLPTTGGTGVGLTVDVSDRGSFYSTITINTPGSGYTDGDEITVTRPNVSETFTITVPANTWTLNTNGRTTFPIGVVPAHSYGAAGDKKGMLVFDDTYIYYCTADYIDNVTDIWKRTAHGAGTW